MYCHIKNKACDFAIDVICDTKTNCPEWLKRWKGTLKEAGDMKFSEQKKLIAQAKKHIAEYDFHLANYVLRDSPVVKEVKELSDLSWAMHQDGNVAKNDVLFLIELIEKEMQKEE